MLPQSLPATGCSSTRRPATGRGGSVVVIREPDSGELAIKRVAAGPGDRVPFADGYLILAEDEAWLVADSDEETARAAGFGEPIDSRRYGPVPWTCWSGGPGSATGRSNGSARSGTDSGQLFADAMSVKA